MHNVNRGGAGEKRRRPDSPDAAASVSAVTCRLLVLGQGLGDLVGDVHGVVDVLDVLQLVEAVDETLDLLGVGHGDLRWEPW